MLKYQFQGISTPPKKTPRTASAPPTVAGAQAPGVAASAGAA